MYHFELKDFPNVYSQFNLSERDMALFLVEWVGGEKVEVGERRWDPQETELTVIEGPQLELNQLSMGRGWAAAVSAGTVVTERVLDAVRNPQPDQDPPVRPAGPASVEDLLGDGGAELLERWLEVAARSPELRPSESLALAEHALRTDGR